MPSYTMFNINMHRESPSVPWGFRMEGKSSLLLLVCNQHPALQVEETMELRYKFRESIRIVWQNGSEWKRMITLFGLVKCQRSILIIKKLKIRSDGTGTLLNWSYNGEWSTRDEVEPNTLITWIEVLYHRVMITTVARICHLNRNNMLLNRLWVIQR